ncbi:MAG: sugar transferase [Bryobacterales bacterium]|nr:sugar transferase [Bryobacterales bacterium]
MPTSVADPIQSAGLEGPEKKSLLWLKVADRLLAAVLLVFVLPVLPILALMIRILSRRSPFVAHLRVGRDGGQLWMVKFRTMWPRTAPMEDCPIWIERIASSEVPAIKTTADPRITSRFGAWCRAHSVDELPQLWHAARGEMSLVGPRPVTAKELEEHYGEHAAEVLRVKPGITGLWQISGRNHLSYGQRLRLDLCLVRHYSPKLYFQILLRTIPRVLSGAGAG